MASGVSTLTEPTSDAPWPAAGGESEQVVVLRFATSPTERAVLDAWLQRARPDSSAVEVLEPADPRLEETLERKGGDPLIAPIRVAWLPREREGARAARMRDLLVLRNPRRPTPRAQERILRREPDRCRVVVAEPAPVSDLRARLRASGGHEAFNDFVTRQAALALERAERAIVGSQYKVPRFVSEDIRSSGHFRGAVARLAEELERPDSDVAHEAGGYIDEMVASQSRLAIDAWSEFAQWLSRAYKIDIDTTRLEELRELNSRHALVFLPSHRSYLDPLVLRQALHEHGFPPNHTMGGINVAIWPLGPVAKRSGYVFIRRSFRDNEVYKFALRQYMAYLMRKRFNLEWYIEGGRSRTGKLRPPRYGLLSYLVDAFRDGSVEDVYVVPVSIVYDQLYEIGAMAAEERGAQKTAESLGWLVGYARAQGRGFGTARVSFGEPLSMRAGLEAAEQGNGAEPARGLAVEKVAFEVCHRIGRATPITPNALLAFALLGAEGRALTLDEVRAELEPLLEYVEVRSLPFISELDLRTTGGLRQGLDALARHGVATCFADGTEPVWAVGPDRELEAAFYRNVAVHFFVNRAIAELMLARAAEGQSLDVREDAWQEALRLRDLLKFEFFFADKADFAIQMREEMAIFDSDWEHRSVEPDEAMAALMDTRLHLAHRVLRPFLEAYAVVGDRLAQRDGRTPIDDKQFLDECLAVARQYRMQQRLRSPESISKELFGNALRLARNRDLVDVGPDDLVERREAFAEEVNAEVRRTVMVRDLAHGRLSR